MKKVNKKSLKKRNSLKKMKRNSLKIRKRYGKKNFSIRKKNRNNKKVKKRKNKTLNKNFKGGAIPFSELKLIPETVGHKLGGFMNNLTPKNAPVLNNPTKMNATDPNPTNQFVRSGGTTEYSPTDIKDLYNNYYQDITVD